MRCLHCNASVMPLQCICNALPHFCCCLLFVVYPLLVHCLRLRCPWGCATGTPAGLRLPSCGSSGPPAPRWCYWGPALPSPDARGASCCCGDCKRTHAVSPPTAGTGPPGRWTSPCMWGWAGRGKPTSCTWTSACPWSPAWSALRRCLQSKGVGRQKFIGFLN